MNLITKFFAQNQAPQTSWKQKAKDRRSEIRALEKRLKELKHSRDSWKTKAQFFKLRYLEADSLLKKRITHPEQT
jgi:hypothetical protein